MTEIERLILEVEQKGVSGVNRALDEMNSKTKAAEKGMSGLKASTIAFAAATATLAGGVFLLGRQLIVATKSYQGFMAQLTTSTKSSDKAKQAFLALQDFAETTPYSMAQATESFIMLINRGLDPSEKALRSFGNTASSQNKELVDLVRATDQAVTGEYEALKGFGIGMRKDGDQITATFQGHSETMKNTGKAIQDFIVRIGENQFGGAMARQMDTLAGKMSNLGDAWEQMWQNISNLGPASFLTQGFGAAADALSNFNSMILSGELESRISQQKVQWQGFFDDITESTRLTGEVIRTAVEYWSGLFGETTSDVDQTLKYWPVYARAATQTIAAYILKMWHEADAVGKWWEGMAKLYFTNVIGAAEVAGKTVLEALKGNFVGAVTTATSETQKLTGETAASIKKLTDDTGDLLRQEDNIFSQTMESIAAETSAVIKSSEDKGKAADALRAKYDAAAAARKADTTDKLAEFKVPGGENTVSADAAKKALKDLEQIQAMQFKMLEDGFVAHTLAIDQVIDSSYEIRKQKILDNTATTEAEKKALVLAALSESIVSEEQAIQNSYTARREFILSATALTEQQKTELMTRLTIARDEQIKALEDKTMKERLGAASEFFGNIASIGSTFGKQGFEIAKAAAIAQATIKTYESATSAYSALSGIPYIGPALGAAAAAAAIVAGLANVAQIKAQQYTPPSTGMGAYAHGGMVPAGRYGLVGEGGPEIVRGPAVVTSAATTAEHGRATSGVRTVTIQNHGQPVDAESRMNGDNLEIILRPILDEHKRKTKDEIAQDFERGGGPISRSVERNYGLRREGRI